MFLKKKAPFFAVTVLLAIFSVSNTAAAQTKNNPYSPSPNASSKQGKPTQIIAQPATEQNTIAKVSRDMEIRRPSADVGITAANIPDSKAANPVETYRVGVGDVLFVNLKNTAAASGYYTVRPNGTIDYPLAGNNVVVTGRTAAELETSIASAITLYSRPQIEVKVREFASHKINVTGMVERSGERNIQREAIPLYVIRADALVDTKATKALIRRTDMAKVETYELHDPKTDDVLIFPGNSVEFTVDSKNSVLASTGFYYIAGEIKSAGQKDLVAGTTLSQAISVAGGCKGNPKKALIRRKGDNGNLNVAEHDLRSIKDGEAQDPALLPGDMIEIAN